MIKVHRLNQSEFVINADLIETVEGTPDTVVILTTGKQFVVLESVDSVIDKVIYFRARLASLGDSALDLDLRQLMETGEDTE